MEKIENSVYILAKLNYRIQNSIELVHTIGLEHNFEDGKIQSLFYYIMEFGMINAVSFDDELVHHLMPSLKASSYENYDALTTYIKFWRREISDKFKDLKVFRNHYLAHNIRIDKRENTLTSGRFRLYRVPQDPVDYYYLAAIINAINNVIASEFPKAYGNIQHEQLTKNSSVPHRSPLYKSVDEMNSHYNLKVVQIGELMTSKGF